tara:strand:+ start:5492 stop:6763 length:1272 start_codon:yes stop_codon:yes gene_type:complete
MRLLKKIFHNFFLIIIINIIIVSKSFSGNNFDETISTSILERLPTSIFATVNEEPISIYDLIQRSNLFSVSARMPIDKNFEIKILPDLISSYIDEILQTQEINKSNIIVPDDQVKQMISNIEKENSFEKGQLEKFLKENKTDIKILEKQLRANIGWRQLIAQKFRSQIIIQDTEVDTLHNNIKSGIGKDEFFIEQVFISFENRKENEVLEKINNIYDQITKGGDFSSIAKQFSDTFEGKIGKIGWVSEDALDQKIIDSIKNLKINKLSKPLKGNDGYFIIKVSNKRIIGEEVIENVSLFRFRLIIDDEKVRNLIKDIKDCDQLQDFSNKYATTDSGALGDVKYSELSKNLRDEVKRLKKNEISDFINFGNDKFQIMVCDVKKVKPIIPSKYKIRDILVNKKLDTIARQYMSELRSKAIIDIRI